MKKLLYLRNRNFGRSFGRKTVSSCTDGWECNRFYFLFSCKLKTLPVAGSQKFVFSFSAALPYRTNGMYNVFCRQKVPLCNLCFSCRAAIKGSTLFQQLGTRSHVDSPIYSPPPRSALFAAFTMASTFIFTISPSNILILSGFRFILTPYSTLFFLLFFTELAPDFFGLIFRLICMVYPALPFLHDLICICLLVLPGFYLHISWFFSLRSQFFDSYVPKQ